LNLAQVLFENNELHGMAFNFGPRAEQNHTVKQLLTDLSEYWDFKNSEDAFKVTDNIAFYEAGLLKLNCDKALFFLKWQASLEYAQTIKLTSQWYYNFYQDKVDMLKITQVQIDEYEIIAKDKLLIWTA
jgi:CDP-glucose 4,6-dehydratase